MTALYIIGGIVVVIGAIAYMAYKTVTRDL
jgi:hypothetical protein